MISTNLVVRILGFSIISLILFGTLVVCFVIGVGLITAQGKSLADFNALHNMQRAYYFGGMRNIWQYQSDCVDVGGELIYQPKFGECSHSNLEFSTTLTFDDNGRQNSFSYDPNLPRIAVLGDSHAMGWGVNDDKTFSAELQRITNRRVYNLGVSSYATERELDRLALLKDLNSVDTVIIQYCDNDLGANREYPIDRNLASERFNIGSQSYNSSQGSALLRNFLKALPSLIPIPIKVQIKSLLGLDASASNGENEHRHSVERILAEYSELLEDKEVYVIFISGHNKAVLPDNWEGNFSERDLRVNFIDLNMERNHFYDIDDHLNEHGHLYIASQINSLIDD
tara:strand:+ start:929 stop:1951 length:1023 start_codon:yes stop_codon:yes gene_type:complete